MPGLVVKLDDDILAEIFEGTLSFTRAIGKGPHFIGPGLELQVMGNAAFQGDGSIFRLAGRAVGTAGVAAFPVRNDLGRTRQPANFTDAGDC